MKTNFGKWAVTLMTGAAFLAASCDEKINPEPEKPVFPENIGTITVAPGDALELNITANLDWELEIEADNGTEWFWFLSGSQPVNKISGAATEGETVTIHVSENEEFDTDRQAVVKMTMGGQTETIATYLRPSKERHLELYVCEYDEYDFSYTDEGEYKYSEAPVDESGSFPLVWPEGGTTFTMPVKVVSNFNWELAELPEWISASGLADENRAGTVEFRLVGVPSRYDLAGAEGTVAFQNGESEFTYKVILPESAGTVRSSFASGLSFTASGLYQHEYGTAEAAFGSITSAKGLKIIPVTLMNNGYWYVAGDYFFNWCHVDAPYGEWDDNDEDLIQDVNYRISLDANTSSEVREAYILAIPAVAVPDNFDPGFDLFNDEGTELLPEYEDYIITTVTQASAAGGAYFSFQSGEGATFAAMDPAHEYYNALVEDCSDLYVLTFTESFGAYVGVEPASMPEEWMITTTGYENMEWPFVNVSVNQYGSELSVEFSVNQDNVGQERQDCFIQFRDASGNFLAIVYCVFDPNGGSGSDSAPFSFAYPEMVYGVTLEQYSGDTSAIKGEFYGVEDENIWELKFTTLDYSGTVLNVPYIPDELVAWNNYPVAFDYWLAFEQAGDNQIYVDVYDSVSASDSDYLVFKNGLGMFEYVLVCTYDPQE